MPELKEMFTEFVSKTLKLDESGVASLFNEDGTVKDDSLNLLLEKDAVRIKTIKPDTKKLFDDGYKKAQAEVLSKLENSFKEQTGFDSEKQGVELFLEYAESKTKSTAISDDAVKKHPVYISMADKLKKDNQEAVKLTQQEFENFKKGITEKETFDNISKKAIDIFNSLKPILSKDAVRAKNQMEDFVSKLKSYQYDIQGDRIVVLKDNKALEDNHGHAIPFDAIVKETAERFFDFQVTDPERKSTANGSDKNGTPAKKIDIKVPQNDKEYTAALMDTNLSVEEKTAIKTAYKELTN